MEQIRVNCTVTEGAMKLLDQVRAKYQQSSMKPLSRPDMIRIAIEELIKREIK